jgi:D-proline reductase (dithiol) PrdB
MNFSRLKNRILAKVLTRYPSLSRGFINSYTPWEANDIPWTPVKKLLRDSKVSIITTAGVHHKNQQPFDMNDPDGDPTFREIDITLSTSDLTITHDYYDHTNADRDINIVFPVERLKELEKEGIIGRLSQRHYGFMGHIKNHHISSLINVYAPEVAKRLKTEGVDVALLTPG